jgi:hypothetical protein
MINKPVIIGCGTLGSCLAIRLAQEKLISELKIYDFDFIDSKPTYPFITEEADLPKVQVIRLICKKYNPNLQINVYKKYVTKPLLFDSFIIDCRDSKSTFINSNIKLSLDGYLLYIDSIQTQKTFKDYSRYISPRNEKYINSGIDIIMEYLKNEEYIHRDMKLYDLQYGDSYIIKKESDNGCD